VRNQAFNYLLIVPALFAGVHPAPAQTSKAKLSIVPAGNQVVLSWPVTAANCVLQSTTNLFPAAWSLVSAAPVVVNGQYTATNPTSGTQQFYQLSQLDPQTVFYTNLIGLNDPWMAYRFNRFILAVKSAGLYGSIIDAVLLRTNWQSSPSGMVTFFGKPVTNNNAAFTPQGVSFDGATACLKFPCALPGSNTIYCMSQPNTAGPFREGAGVWVAFLNSDPDTGSDGPYSYGEAETVNFVQAGEYDFIQFNKNPWYNMVVEPVLLSTYETTFYYDLSPLDGARHSVSLSLNGITGGYSIVDSALYSQASGTARQPSNTLDTVAIGNLIHPQNALPPNNWFAFNANLTAAQLKVFENALMWLDPEQAEVVFAGDSRMANHFETSPDSSLPFLLMSSAYGNGKVGRRFAFSSAAPYANNTNFPDLIPQYINKEACPNVEAFYQFGYNIMATNNSSGYTNAPEVMALVTNDWIFLTGLGCHLDAFTDLPNMVNGPADSPYSTVTNQIYFNVLV
jgi:hypothetical protein